MTTQMTLENHDENNTQTTTTALTSELDAKISKMKKAFDAQLEMIKEQNEVKQREYEV